MDLFGQYKLLITPALYSVSDALTQALARYVKQGGVLLSTFRTAAADRMLKIYHDDLPHGLTKVFGMTYDQFTDGINVGLKEIRFKKTTDSINQVNSLDKSRCVRHWMELLLPQEAEQLASYDHPHWGSNAAITGNAYGAGYAAYLGCYTDSETVKQLLAFLCEKAGITHPEEVYPVIVKRGVNALQKEIVYYFNYSEDPQTITYHGADALLLLAGHTLSEQVSFLKDGDTLTLACWDFIILERDLS